MADFVGEHSAKLDDKGRLVLPSEFRAQASPFAGSRYIVRKDLYSKALELYPPAAWDDYANTVKSKLNMLSPNGRKAWEVFNSGRAMVESDEKTGRILIPKALLERIGVQKDVVFVGMDSVIHLWAKEEWDARQLSDEEAAALFAEEFSK